MTEAERKALAQEQKTLIRRYREYEAMQRDFSYDPDFYSYAEEQKQKLDDRAEYVRGLIEGRFKDDE